MFNFRHHGIGLVVLSLLSFLAEPAFGACSYQTMSMVDVQTCVTGVGFLNSTINSQDEICSIYEETLYCVQRKTRDLGLNCPLTDIGSSMSSIYKIIGPEHFDFSTCTLTPEVGDICTREDRLTNFTLLACDPYLSQMTLYSDSTAACVYSSSLVQCAEQSLGYLSVKCSKFQIEEAFRSQATKTYLSSHAPGLDLSVCFKTVGAPGTSSEKNCVDYPTIFSYNNVTTCMASIARANFTDNMPQQEKNMQCSYVQEVLACMVKQLAGTGSHCSMKQMQTAVNTYIHLSGMTSTLQGLSECQVNDSYLTTSMCDDDFRLVSFFTTSGVTVLESLTLISNKDLVCNMLKSYFGVLSNGFDVKCSTSDLFSAFLSPFGTSFFNGHYPTLDFNHCPAGSSGKRR